MRAKTMVVAPVIAGALFLLLASPVRGQSIPAPESVLGHKPGDDFYLANYDESREYFRKLADLKTKELESGLNAEGLSECYRLSTIQQEIATAPSKPK